MKPRGRIGSVSAAVSDAARALRRARGGREARVRLYDARGQALTLDPADPRAQAIAEEAAAMIDVVDTRSPDPAADAGARDAGE